MMFNVILRSKSNFFQLTILLASSLSVPCESENKPPSASVNASIILSTSCNPGDEVNTTKSNLNDTLQLQPDIICSTQICARKCCKFNQVLSNKGCVDFRTLNYTLTPWWPDLRFESNSMTVNVLCGFPKKNKDKVNCYKHEENEFELQKDGKILFKELDETFSNEFYCIEKLIYDGGETLISAICYKPKQKDNLDIIADWIHFLGLLVSCVSLAAILLLHLLSKEYKGLQTKCMIFSCINILLGFILLTLNMSKAVDSFGKDLCIAIAIAIQYFSLSFYFWLNVMCYETSRIIRGTVKTVPLSHLKGTNRRFLCYAIYSVVSPLLISGVTCIIQYLPPELSSTIIRPEIAIGRCWFKEEAAPLFTYFYGIEITLHIVNASLMGHAALLLHGNKVTCLCFKKSSLPPLQIHRNIDQVSVFWHQLFIFILYVFIWSLNCVTLIHKEKRFWRIIDALVVLQGLFLLIIVVKSKRSMLSKSYLRATGIAKGLSTSLQRKTPTRSL